MDASQEVIIGTIRQIIQSERAACVLEISGFDSRYGRLISEWEGFKPPRGAAVDRIDLTDGGIPGSEGIYNNVYGPDAVSGISKLSRYDIIIVFHLFENMPAPDAKTMLEQLLKKAEKQVLVITPEYPYDLESEDENKKSDVRAYHPVFFSGMDFSHKMLETADGNIQAYSFFPEIKYEPQACDVLPETPEMTRKLRIAYILAHHTLTGGMKAVFQQMKALADRGHDISVYYRNRRVLAERAVPSFSELIYKVPKQSQVIIPPDANYLDYIGDEDIIILSWVEMAREFVHSKTPAALWEQGTPFLFGDWGELITCDSLERTTAHGLYRIPVPLLTVSPIMQTILKGVYYRDAQYFPCVMDTDFYHPRDGKHNETPIVLLVGEPTSKFKGFGHAFKVLEAAYETGMEFKVQIVSQTDFSLMDEPLFAYEKIISPPQKKLAEIYRDADILISASLYESFGLPPLEAMASGTAVIAMDCGGINTYAEPGVNCLLCEQGDIASMFIALQHLIQNPDMRGSLAAAGRETALRFSPPNIAPVLEQCLYKIAEKARSAGRDGV